MADDDDARDERLGRLLEVEPLDEVARRRLVSTAMRSAAAPARTRSGMHAGGRFAAAASVVVILVVGLGYLALRGDDGTAPSASAPRREAATTAPVAGSSDPAEPTAQANADTSAGSEAAGLQPKTTSGGPQGLGDVGDLEVASNLVRLRTWVTGSAFAQAAGGSAPSDPVSLVGRLRALRCAAQLPDGTIVAIGTGRFGTREAIVVATMLADGTTSLDAVVTDPCEVRPLD